MNEDDIPARQLPINELDLQLSLINTEWGDRPKSNELGTLTQDFSVNYPKGTIIQKEDGSHQELTEDVTIYGKSGLWGMLSYLTRDMRLGNLSGSDLNYCVNMLDLAGDCLQSGYMDAFSICIKRVAHKLELSQSRGGFLRKLINTIRREEYKNELDPKKSKILGGGEK